MNIIIGFSKAKYLFKIGSKLIQLVEKRPYSHVYIKYTHPLTDIELVSQASHGFVNQFNYDLFKKDNDIIYEYQLNVPDDKLKELLTFIHTNIGIKYSIFQLVLITIKKLLRLELNIRNYDMAYICSEYAARICQIVGITNINNLDYTTPSDLEYILVVNNIKRVR